MSVFVTVIDSSGPKAQRLIGNGACTQRSHRELMVQLLDFVTERAVCSQWSVKVVPGLALPRPWTIHPAP